ncbi:MAG: DUF3046 domain-containing protein [Propionibacteriaceae bacterium]|nr:DUF3046 domain-containing protein [Propionibacteriaceae bacterium]
MRETELWRRLGHHLGAGYAHVWADQTVISELGGRTVTEALAAGLDAQRVWRAVWGFLELSESER